MSRFDKWAGVDASRATSKNKTLNFTLCLKACWLIPKGMLVNTGLLQWLVDVITRVPGIIIIMDHIRGPIM